MNDLLSESLLSFSEAARSLPPFRRNQPVSPATIFRWAMQGIQTGNGTILKLEAIRLGGRWLTSKQALQRFSSRQTEMHFAAGKSEPRAPQQRRRANEHAEKILKAIGI